MSTNSSKRFAATTAATILFAAQGVCKRMRKLCFIWRTGQQGGFIGIL